MRFADALEGAILQQAKQFRLHRQGHIADLIEKQRTSLGGGHFAFRVLHGSREGAARMAEQLTLQQLARQTGTMDDDEGSAGAGAAFVNGPRQDALAGAALSAEQYGRLARRHLEGQVERLPHRRLLGVEIHLRSDPADLLLQARHLIAQAPHLPPAFQHESELIRRERLGQVVESAGPHRFDCRGDAGMGRDDHDRQPRRFLE